MDKPDNRALKLKEGTNWKTSKRTSNKLAVSKSFSRSSCLLSKDASKKVPRPIANTERNSFADSYLRSDSCNTRFLWKPKNCRKEEVIDQSKLHSTTGTLSSIKLGHSISSENSLHAVHGQDENDEECVVDGGSTEECIGDVVLLDTGSNQSTAGVKEQLFDSKSNRMLQSINPNKVKDVTKCHSFIDSVGQIENLPRKKNPNGAVHKGTGDQAAAKKSPKNTLYDVNIPNGDVRKPYQTKDMAHEIHTDGEESTSPVEKSTYGAVRRTSRTVFTGKMEVLQERDDSSAKSVSTEDKDVSNTTSSPCNTVSDFPTMQQQSNLHAGMPAESIKPNSPADNEHATVIDILALDETQKPTESSKFLTAICQNHKRRKAGGNTDAVLFCKICLQAVCYKCAFERHKDHDVLPLASAVTLIRSKMADRKREIENSISQMRGRRKIMESSADDIRKRIKSQLERTVERLQEKGDEIMSALEKRRQDRIGSLYRLQAHNETSWGQIDAVLKTTDDVKMLEEFSSLGPETVNLGGFASPTLPPSCLSPVVMHPRVGVDLHKLQEEIENLRLHDEDDSNSGMLSTGDINDTSRKKKKLAFKLDANTAGAALRISPNGTSVEYVGSARSHVHGGHLRIHPHSHTSSLHNTHPYPAMSSVRLRRSNFATVLSDTSITQGKQYWEISVNRSMEYRLGVAYKHMQGTKTLADEHNSWTLCLTYPDRFSALNKGKKEYIFVASHIANSTAKVMRIGLYLDYERGILSFYNASNSAEKRHLYTFRAFFNRPVWPLISLRQGKLQLVTGLPIPRNLVWKTR